jgi:hypothetical protein
MPDVEAEVVRDLFVPGTRVWDETKVRTSLIALDAMEVLKIKPGVNMESDVVAWAYEKSGLYSVRSAYRLLKEEQAALSMAATGETGASREEKVWGQVWKLNVPPKVRTFW